jgi:hypothetical protein
VIIVEAGEIAASPATTASTEPDFPAWVDPTLRTKIGMMLAHWGGTRGLTIRVLREKLGTAFEIDDTATESRRVDSDLEWLLPYWGFVQTGERRWRVPPAPGQTVMGHNVGEP